MKISSIMRTAAFAAVLAGATALTLPAFAANVPDGTNLAQNQTFKYRVLDAINSLDPDIVEDVDTSYVVSNLFEGLYNEDAKGNPVPGVAKSYDVNDDKTVYTFHLRDDAVWSNGDPVTAQDFVFAWRRAVDPALASPYAYFPGLVGVKNADDIVAGKMKPEELGVKAIDDKTLEVDLNASVPYFVRTTAHATLFPVPQKVVEEYGDDWTKPEHIVGNGAYVLVENKPGERVTLERNPKYWDNANTVIEKVEFLTINDENQGVTRYLAGEVDQTDIPAGQYPAMSKKYADQAHSVPQLCNYYFSMNMTDSQMDALKDVRVREALYLAVDRDVIVNNILQGGQTPAYYFTPTATAGFVAPKIPYADMTQAERDAKAKELMKEAGYGPDHPLKFTYIYNTSEAHKKIAIAVSQMYKEKLGVDMQIQDMEFKTLLDRRHQYNYQVARNAWCGDYNEASTFLSLLDSRSSQNDSGYKNQKVDDLLDAAKTADDPNKQYEQVEEIIAKDVPVIPIYFYSKVFLQKPNVKGWPYDNVEQLWYAKDLYKVAE